ncbi:bifunctional DNA-formamidopyrimidine glycosylase/DNA-(apurinic or apyrimidinic site) lyase [Alteromonas gracilis]|uniref:bifunctional DNA-formamidopyrimidine glycosylase/DNA-(apurinic or apyrimidinic site) lyase n=1 Tax=Alteromonas gracilis TaxID=1479524 RepID=UPI0037360F9C
MPELPEVEVSRLGVSPHLVGNTITQVVVRERRMRWPIPHEVSSVEGHKVIDVKRRAKYLLIETAVGTLILHLGMSGKLRVIDAATPIVKHDHVDIVLNTGKCLRLNDPRRFGAVLFQAPNTQIAMLGNLGPEPLTDDFDDKRLFALSRNRKGPVKNFIMDNAIVVGVGNIYANEALFLAGIDPRRAAGNISAARYKSLTATIKQVLAKAIEQGGTTLKDFAQTDGKPGYFAQHLNVYGRKGEPCEVCGKTIESKVIGQRNTFFCTHCQR